jgi:hypothetical protein
MLLAACERGCARPWVTGQRAGETSSSGLSAMNAVDCPDGLARCEHGVVSASRLATISLPCNGGPARCACPWDVLGSCAHGCAVDGVELVIDQQQARTQLCAPPPDASVFARSTWPVPVPSPCPEGQRYACREGMTLECASSTAIGRCTQGCYAEGASIEDERVGREAAFAVLCSR